MKARVLLLICSVVVVAATTSSECWLKSGDRFYKCFNDERVTYQQAQESCISLGGRLAAEVLRDPVAASYIASNCYSSELRPWVGFDEIAEEGTWIWSDGGSMNPVTTAWNPGEPNNYDGVDEDCANIWNTVSNNKLFLNDAPCHVTHAYICEVYSAGQF